MTIQIVSSGRNTVKNISGIVFPDISSSSFTSNILLWNPPDTSYSVIIASLVVPQPHLSAISVIALIYHMHPGGLTTPLLGLT